MKRSIFFLLAAVTFLSACEELGELIPRKPVESEVIQPEGPNPEWAPDIDPQMWAVLEQLASYGTPPLPELNAMQARTSPSFRDAANDILKKFNITPKPAAVSISQLVIPNNTDDGLLARMYTPTQGAGPFPVITYFHGGGWVIAGPGTYESSAIALAEKTGAIVVAVAYRQAPENPYPAAHYDAFATYQWVREHADEWGGDPERVATAGESAGGNMAVSVALLAKEAGVALPDHIVSVYPVADDDVQSPSYDQYANAAPLNRAGVIWFFDRYVPAWNEGGTNMFFALVRADLSGLPPTTIINAEIDPLEAEGGELANQLEAAGVEVTRKVYDNVTHEFFGLNHILEQAEDAQNLAAQALKKTFDQ